MRVLVDVDNAIHPTFSLLTGVQRFAKARGDWELLIPGWDGPAEALAETCDGYIIRHTRHRLVSRGDLLPRTVLITGEQTFPASRALRVWHDDVAIAQQAAEYLFGLGHRRFIVRTDVAMDSLHGRMDAFAKAATALGGSVHAYGPTDRMEIAYTLTAEYELLARQIPDGDEPFVVVGYEACSTRRLLTGLQTLGVPVPERAAVFALEDMPEAAEAATPCLSAMQLSFEALGYAAAEALHLVLSEGYRQPPDPIPPQGVIERGSSQVLSQSRDPVIAALRAIDAAPDRSWDVSQLAAVSGVSRRSLERAFAVSIGRSPAQELMRMRLTKAASLLSSSDLPIADVAGRCGFSSHSHFCQAFKRRFGMPPKTFRRG